MQIRIRIRGHRHNNTPGYIVSIAPYTVISYLRLGRNLLRLEADVEGGNLAALLVRLKLACHHTDEGRLARPVLAQQDDDLAVRELSGVHLQVEVAHRFLHARVVVPGHPLNLLLRGVFRDLEDEGVLAEPEVLRRHEAVQEDVDALTYREGHGDHAVSAWHAVQAAHKVGEIIQHGEIVLHHNDVLVRADQVPSKQN